MRGKKSRLAAGVAAAGACALLAACSPVKMGSAAIVGNDRITTASLSSQVSNLQSDVKGAGLSATDQQLTTAVLEWLIKFKIGDRVASNAGITVSQTDVSNALNLLSKDQNASLQANGQAPVSKSTAVTFQGVPATLTPEFGTYLAQFLAFEEQANGGTAPAAASQAFVGDTAYTKAACQAQKSLNIQVNPQYGQFDYNTQAQGSVLATYVIVPSNDVLSRPTGAASPATTPSFPSC